MEETLSAIRANNLGLYFNYFNVYVTEKLSIDLNLNAVEGNKALSDLSEPLGVHNLVLWIRYKKRPLKNEVI